MGDFQRLTVPDCPAVAPGGAGFHGPWCSPSIAQGRFLLVSRPGGLAGVTAAVMPAALRGVRSAPSL